MQAWKRIQPTVVHKVGYRTIVTKTFELPNGEVAAFDTICPEAQEFVAVIALTPENKVVTARQFRFGPELIMDELPGGFVDKGETPEQAMRRELSEETGYEAQEVAYLGPSHKDTYMNAVWHLFLATDCKLAKTRAQHSEIEEHVEVRLISMDELLYNANHDRMTDAVGVLMAYDELQKRRAQSHEV